MANAKQVITGSQLQVSIWEEDAWGTEASETKYVIPVKSEGLRIGQKKPLAKSALVKGGRSEGVPYRDLVDAQGLRMNIMLGYNTARHWLKFVLGDFSGTGASAPYTWTRSGLGSLPSFGLEVTFVQPTASESLKATCLGCHVTQARFPLVAPGGEVSCEITFNAQSVTWANEEADTATDDLSSEELVLHEDLTSVELNSSEEDDISELTTTISTGVQHHHTGRASSSGQVGLFEMGETTIRSALSAFLTSGEWARSLAENDTEFGVTVTFNNGGSDAAEREISFEFVDSFMDHDHQEVSGPQGVMVSGTIWSVDNDGTGAPIKVTLKDSVEPA